MNIWLVRDGAKTVESSSIYTAGKFEGLALVVDQYGGSGMVRGFLNDGTSDYKSLNKDGLAFGQCHQIYRNLGRPMQIKLRQTPDNFKVDIDGVTCFESNKVSIPAGYQLGITAATSDNPDSFEVFKMTAMTQDIKASTKAREQGYAAREQVMKDWQQSQAQANEGQGQSGGPQGFFSEVTSDGRFKDEIADADAETFTTSKAQFVDLHARIQGISHHISTMYRSQHEGARALEDRFGQIMAQMQDMKSFLQTKLEKLDKFEALEQRASILERELKDMRSEITRRIKESEAGISRQLGGAHQNLAETVKTHAAPGHGRLIFIIVASQVLLVVGFVVYKRRKNSMPKKYL
jgi:lectin, mannose-binding 1